MRSANLEGEKRRGPGGFEPLDERERKSEYKPRDGLIHGVSALRKIRVEMQWARLGVTS